MRFKIRLMPPAALLAALIAALLAMPAGCVKNTTKPDVLIICVDSLRPDFMGAYGGESKASSLMDNVAKKGMRFDNAYTTAPWALPALASILTGLYPSEHGAIDDKLPIRSKSPTLAEIMRENGYKTGGISAHHLLGKEHGFGRGFDNYYQLIGSNSDALVDRAVQWLDDNEGQPKFLFCHLMDTHAPYKPPASLVSKYYPPNIKPIRGGMTETLSIMEHWPTPEAADALEAVKALYMAEIEHTDRALVKLIRYLQKKRMDRKTLIVIVSGNGEEFMEHGLMNHGFSLYREQVNIPLIISWPDKFPGGASSKEYVSLVDIMPTILDIAGVAIPGEIQGSSLKGILQSSVDNAGTASLGDRALLIETTRRGPDRVAVIKDGMKYIESPDFEINGCEMGSRLYDLSEDPLEQKDLLPDMPDKAGEFRELIDESGLFVKNRLWSIRFANSDTPKIYSGSLATSGKFLTAYKNSVRFVSRHAGQVLSRDFLMTRSDRKIRYAASAELGDNGVQFVVEPEGALVQATLLVNGRKIPAQIKLGEGGDNPDSIPFALEDKGSAKVDRKFTGYCVSSTPVYISKSAVPGYETGDAILPTLDVLRGVKESLDLSGIDELRDLSRFFSGDQTQTQNDDLL